MEKKIRILMVTVVWGDLHCDSFMTANLPTLMAPRNLPELARRCDLTYRIYTHRTDVGRLMSSPLMQEIRALMPIEVEILSDKQLGVPVAAHQWAWERAVRDAKGSGRNILLIPPDTAWADGSLAHIADLLTAGKKAIFMTYLRVVTDTFIPALRKQGDSAYGAIVMGGSDMVALALRHLHPLMAAYCYDSPYFPSHAEMILWPVRGEGFLVRVLAREMFLFDPGRISLTPQWLMDANYDPREVIFIDDSDRLFAVSLAPLGKDVAWHMQYCEATPLVLARWWLQWDGPSNDFVAAARIRWHTASPTAKVWRRQEIKSNRLVRDAMTVREGLRIWREINSMQCHVAASILALATGVGLLVKSFSSTASAVIFVPTDSAFHQLRWDFIDELVNAKNAPTLTAFLRRHVVLDASSEVAGFTRSSAGILKESQVAVWLRWLEASRASSASSRLTLFSAGHHTLIVERRDGRLTVNGVEVMEPGHQVKRYLIYRIAGVLDQPERKPVANTQETGTREVLGRRAGTGYRGRGI